MEVSQHSKNNNFNLIHISFKQKTAVIALQGAQVLSVIDQGRERLWLSPNSQFEQGTAVRGGIPICWPWFGDSAEPGRPAHGIARTALWQVTELEQTDLHTCVYLEPQFSPEESALIPEGLTLKLRIELDLKGFCCTLISHNTHNRPVSFTEALHSYLPVSSIENISIDGLHGCTYADKLTNYQIKSEQNPTLFITEPTDRIYFDNSAHLDLIDQGLGQTTRIEKQNSETTVIWNPGEERAAEMADLGGEHYQGFVCVEASNAFDRPVQLAPNGTHRLSQRLSWYPIEG